MRLLPKPLHYAWIIAGVTFFVLLVSAGVRATPGVLLVPIEQEFGWTRATTSMAVSVNIALYGLMGPFAAAIVERFGLRRSVASALLVLALAMVGVTFIDKPWQLVLLWGLIIGLGTGMVALVLAAIVTARWFSSQRGLVMGMLSASTASGQLLFLPLIAWTASTQGWRGAVYLVAAGALAASLLVTCFLRNRPADIGLLPYGETDPDNVQEPRRGSPIKLAFGALRDGLKSRDFLILAGTFFICGASTNGLIGTHFIAACLDHGIPELGSAGLLAAMGLFDFFGTTLSGWLSDRWSNRHLLAWYYGLRGLSLIYLPFAFIMAPGMSIYTLGLFSVFYGLDWIATVPPTVRLATNAFGKERVGLMFGWISAAHQLGAASIAFLAGYLRLTFGSYLQAFILSGVLCLIAAILSLMIGRGGRRPAAGAALPAE